MVVVLATMVRILMPLPSEYGCQAHEFSCQPADMLVKMATLGISLMVAMARDSRLILTKETMVSGFLLFFLYSLHRMF